MKRVSLVVASALAGAMVLLSAHTTPVTAAGGSSGPGCPLKNGPGDILIENIAIDVMANDMTFGTPILKEGADAEIVCVKAEQGMAQAYYEDNTIDYVSFGAVGIDKVTVGTVDENGIYNSVVMTYNVTAIQLAAPVVLQKATLKKGEVIKAAVVGFTNGTDRTILVMAGDGTQMEPDKVRNIAPGKTFEMKTKRKKLDFLQFVIVGTGKASYPVVNSFGQANTATGKVRMENLWYTVDTDTYARKAATPSVAAPLHWFKS